MMSFILGISLCLNIILILGYVYIYKKVLKNNPLNRLKNIDEEFWNL